VRDVGVVVMLCRIGEAENLIKELEDEERDETAHANAGSKRKASKKKKDSKKGQRRLLVRQC
jgi:hypothetical protein